MIVKITPVGGLAKVSFLNNGVDLRHVVLDSVQEFKIDKNNLIVEIQEHGSSEPDPQLPLFTDDQLP